MLKDILEQGNKEFEERIEKMICDCHIKNDCPRINFVKSHIKQRELRILEGVKEMCEKMEMFTPPDRSDNPRFTYKDVTGPFNAGYNKALTDLISQLDQVIKEIK